MRMIIVIIKIVFRKLLMKIRRARSLPLTIPEFTLVIARGVAWGVCCSFFLALYALSWLPYLI